MAVIAWWCRRRRKFRFSTSRYAPFTHVLPLTLRHGIREAHHRGARGLQRAAVAETVDRVEPLVGIAHEREGRGEVPKLRALASMLGAIWMTSVSTPTRSW